MGASPFIVPPRWQTRIIDWRERLFRKRLLTRQNLDDFDIEIREMYFEIAAEILDPTPPRLSNTDGDPLALTTLTYELKTTVDEALEKLAPLARVRGEDHVDEVVRDVSGRVTAASLTWVKAGNRQHKGWDNTILGSLRLEPARLVADVNSTRRAERLQREIAKHLRDAAILVETKVIDPTEAIAERRRQRASGDPPGEPTHETPAELQAIEDEMVRQHWEDWLEIRVPALGNKTPRQAARTAGGRERLEALLAEFGREAESRPMVATHLAIVREKLRLPKLV